MASRKLSLGPRELRLLFTLEEEGKEIFLIEDARRILGSTDDSIFGVLRRLKRKGRIRNLEKGKYLLVPARAGVEGSWSEAPQLLVRRLVDESYVGFWSALNHWGLTEQVPRTVFVATTRPKKSVTFGPTMFQFVTLSSTKFFGWTPAKIAGGSFLVSDREKTLVDCLDLPEYAGGMDEVVKGLWEGRRDLDFRKLLKYAKRQGVGVLVRRLGYLLEVLGLAPRVRRRIAATDFNGYMWLDPKGPKRRLGYSKEYGLILNRREEEILAWRGI